MSLLCRLPPGGASARRRNGLLGLGTCTCLADRPSRGWGPRSDGHRSHAVSTRAATPASAATGRQTPRRRVGANLLHSRKRRRRRCRPFSRSARVATLSELALQLSHLCLQRLDAPPFLVKLSIPVLHLTFDNGDVLAAEFGFELRELALYSALRLLRRCSLPRRRSLHISSHLQLLRQRLLRPRKGPTSCIQTLGQLPKDVDAHCAGPRSAGAPRR